jgi:hypothetical protein
MSAQQLLDEIACLDVKVKVDNGKLRYNAPKGTVTPKLLAQLKEHKAEMLELLAPQVTKKDHWTRETTKATGYPTDKSQSLEPCHHGTPGGCWLCKKYGLKPLREKTVADVFENPPYWMNGYISGFLHGGISIEVLACAIAAALGRSPHEWGEKLLPEVAAVAPALIGEKDVKTERTAWV